MSLAHPCTPRPVSPPVSGAISASRPFQNRPQRKDPPDRQHTQPDPNPADSLSVSLIKKDLVLFLASKTAEQFPLFSGSSMATDIRVKTYLVFQRFADYAVLGSFVSL